MATEAQRKAYERKLRQISRNFDRLERATLQQSIKLLRAVRDKIAGHLTGSEFDQFRVAEQQKELDAIIAEYEEQARAMANGASKKSYQLGGQSAIDPLKAAGVNVSFFRPSKAQVEVLAQFSADLIGGVSSDMRTKINRSIRMNALGGNSSLDAMRDITGIMGLPKKSSDPTKGVAYEAERILRTETNRTYNLASFSQMEQLAKDVPGLQKQWMATGDSRTRLSHLQAHGKIVDVADPFIVGGQELMYPGDPRGGAAETINCRCTFGTVIPEIGPVESPLDKEIEDEKAARGVGKEKAAAKKKPEPTKASTPADRVIADAEVSIINQNHETTIVYDTGGNEVLRKDGEKHRVGFTFAELKKLEGATVTHNHPGGLSFSEDDWNLLLKGKAKRLRAVGIGPDGIARQYQLEVLDDSVYKMDDRINEQWQFSNRATDIQIGPELLRLEMDGDIGRANLGWANRMSQNMADGFNSDGVTRVSYEVSRIDG